MLLVEMIVSGKLGPIDTLPFLFLTRICDIYRAL